MVQPHPSAHYNMYSRRLKTEEFKNKRKAIFFIFLTLASLIIIFFYGLPAVIKFAAFINELNQGSLPVEVKDTTPPPPPRLTSLPKATNNERIEVRGNTEAGAKVTIYINGKEEEILSDSSGNFNLSLKLIKGDNYISAKATDGSGNESQKSDTQKITLDTEPPLLEIIRPDDNSEFFGSRQRQLIIEGKTEETARVQINQRQVVVESEGNFTFSTTLQEGENNFTIIAEDEAGNQTESSLSVSFIP